MQKTRSAFTMAGTLLWALVAACTTPYDFAHQYVDASGNPEVGFAGATQTLATFTPGQVLPDTTNVVAMLWPSATTFTGAVNGGGGATPLTLTGTVIDSDSDMVADQLDVTFGYDDGSTQSKSLVRTDAFLDYRCFGGSAGHCAPGLGEATCTFTPVSGDVYDVSVSIPFADYEGDLNPNPNHDHAFEFCSIEQTGMSCTPFAIPETLSNGWDLAASGSTSGTLTLTVPAFDLTPGSVEIIDHLEFDAVDSAGNQSERVRCVTPVG